MRALPVAALAALIILAGCSAPTSSGAVPTPTGPCTEAPKPSPATAAEIDPESYPDPPESWTREHVRTYVEEYEHAFVHNEALDRRPETVHLEVFVQDLNVSRHGDAFVVRLHSYTRGTVERESENGTPTRIYWDDLPSPVSYLVTQERLVRSDPERGDRTELDELRNGSTLECF